ncbi:hypothetical protein [Weissella soli]|uniref:hypothetical protein n=1 Tax=Weissella soli TaxID=155866 RepID=UPI0035A1CC0E
MAYDDELIEKINQRFTKQPNTLYWVRIVYERFSRVINVFFEHAEINLSTYSEYIGEYAETEKYRIHELGKRIERETNVRVEFAGFEYA